MNTKFSQTIQDALNNLMIRAMETKMRELQGKYLRDEITVEEYDSEINNLFNQK